MKENTQSPLLEVKDLRVKFSQLNKSNVYAVNGINLTLNAGESLGIVGESGSGKSQFVLSLMRLLAKNSEVSGEVLFNGQDLLKISTQELNKIRGNDLSMIFQDPMTSLNPYLKIGVQMCEVMLKQGVTKKEAEQRSIDMLNLVGISDPQRRLNNYPHQLSGGMRQRVMIAMAILNNPKLVIADEPTTALDVTLQAQVLNILAKLKEELQLSIILITHDLGVVANLCETIGIFYGGEIVEYGKAENIFNNPQHPYTKALIKSIPRIDQDRQERLNVIEGNPKPICSPPKLCPFLERCSEKFDKCLKVKPTLKKYDDNSVSCLKYENE